MVALNGSSHNDKFGGNRGTQGFLPNRCIIYAIGEICMCVTYESKYLTILIHHGIIHKNVPVVMAKSVSATG